jgi:DNA-binding GntR family transcriptional regulator
VLDAAFARATDATPEAIDRLYALHHAFHARLAQACAGPVTRALLDALLPRLERYEWAHAPLLRRTGAGFGSMHAEHGAIVDAVRAGGADALERAVRDNWTNAAERLAAALEEAPDAQGAAASDAVRG